MLTITHTREAGTLIDGTERGDGTNVVLKAHRWRFSRNLGTWYVPQSRDRAAKVRTIETTAAALREAGYDVQVTIDDTARAAAVVEADKIARQAARADALAAKADRKAGAADAAYARHEAAVERLPEGGSRSRLATTPRSATAATPNAPGPRSEPPSTPSATPTPPSRPRRPPRRRPAPGTTPSPSGTGSTGWPPRSASTSASWSRRSTPRHGISARDRARAGAAPSPPRTGDR